MLVLDVLRNRTQVEKANGQMRRNVLSGDWIVVPRPAASARIRLLCFAHAGGTAQAFYPWPRLLPADVELCALQLPGRARRLLETPPTHMDAILGRLAADTDAVIVINLLPDLAVTPRFRGGAAAVVGRLSSEFNEALAEVAARHGAMVVDLYQASRREVPGHPELLALDGYHPSDLGYARWAELMWEAVQTRIRS